MIMRKSFYGICLLLTLAACGDKPEGNADEVLSAPPFKGLTDSIARFPQDAALYKKRAVLLSLNNQHDLASADYEQAWKLAPDENTALEYITNFQLTGRPHDALTFLKECIKKYPDNPEFKRRLSEILVQTGDNSGAMQQYDTMLAQDSANADAWYEKGVLQARNGDTSGAVQSLQHAYDLRPIYFFGNTLASIYAASLDARTLPFCDTLIARDSAKNQPEPHFIKGMYLSDSHKYKEAIEEFDASIKLDWKFTDAYLEKGIVYFEQKDYKKALETFNFATTVSNSSADAWFWMGRCYEAMGQTDNAIENYRKAYALDRSLKEAKERINNLRK